MGILGIRENHAEPVHTERRGAISLTTRVRNAHGTRTHATGGGARRVCSRAVMSTDMQACERHGGCSWHS